MKKIIGISLLIVFVTMVSQSQVILPQATISNDLIQANLYLPDAQKGYYRGARFDWAGVISELKYHGHSYFGQWFEKYSPTLHDAITGPVDAFFPIGFDEAKAGEQFLKIGVGMLLKQQDTKYSIATPYEIANSGNWKVNKKSNRVIFTHKLEADGYGYKYTKVVELVKGKPILKLSSKLKNTGKRPIETNVYNHNFFVMDQVTTGPDYVVTFPFPVTGELTSGKDLGRLVRNQLVYEKPLVKGNTVFSPGLLGFGPDARDYDIRIENQKTGAAVRITGDQPLLKMVFWSSFKTVCPEPYIAINVKPGGSHKWNINYEFYVNDVKK